METIINKSLNEVAIQLVGIFGYLYRTHTKITKRIIDDNKYNLKVDIILKLEKKTPNETIILSDFIVTDKFNRSYKYSRFETHVALINKLIANYKANTIVNSKYVTLEYFTNSYEIFLKKQLDKMRIIFRQTMLEIK